MDRVSSHVVFYLRLAFLVQSCVADVWFADDLHFPMIVEEGSSHLVTVETSLSEYQLSFATVQLVTLHEYQSLLHGPNFTCKNIRADSEIQRILHNGTETSRDLAEDTDLSDRYYNISFHSGAATFSLEVADDDIFEHDELFVLYIEIPESKTDSSGCATLVKIRDNDSVTFTWNVQRMIVYEDEGIIDKLKILKHGTNEQDVTVCIGVDYAGDIYEAQYGVDYRLLHTVFVFHSWVNNLTVPIEVYNDTIGEVPEHFYLGFRNHCPQDFRNHSIQPHENGVTVSILDRVNFILQPQNMSAEYGGTVKFQCASTSNTLPGWIIGYPNGSESQISYAILPDHIKVIAEGIVVSVTNLTYNLTNYTCIINHLVPNLNNGIFEVVPLRSHTGLLTIVFPPVAFRLAVTQNGKSVNSVYVRKGQIIHLKLMKKGGDNYTYNVSVHSTAELLIKDMHFILDPTTVEENISISIPHDLRLNDTLQFKLIIAEVSTTGYGRIESNVDTGQPINVTLYDNDYLVQFIPDRSAHLSGESANVYTICASITKPSIVDPLATIQLSFKIFKECLIFEGNKISLDSSNKTVCLKVHYNRNCCSDVTIQPQSTTTTYNVTLQPQSINLIIERGCQSGLSGAEKAAIIISTIVVVIMITIIIIFLCCKDKIKQKIPCSYNSITLQH